MNMTWASAVRLAQTVSDYCEGSYANMEIVMCPPFTCLKGVQNVLDFDRSDILLGAQNVHEEMPDGTAACTGEISVEMLKDLDCSFTIIGHSERRAANGETDELVNQKAKLLLDRGITPIICVGESAEVNDRGESIKFVTSQVDAALDGLLPEQVASLVIAYEPIWAIGTGNIPSPEGADTVCGAIRNQIMQKFGHQAAQSVRILYGGSVKPENAKYFFSMDNIDGGLIGGASLDAKKFVEIVRICYDLKCR